MVTNLPNLPSCDLVLGFAQLLFQLCGNGCFVALFSDMWNRYAGLDHRTFQIFTSSIQTVLFTRKLNQRFIGCAKP